jgi:cytochrome oxidase Cu insertion factor (SCO1/SenC/PrrC family)
MAAYGGILGSKDGGADWLFLTTSGHDELDPILESYGQRVDPRKDRDDPMGPYNHLLRVYLIDPEGMIRNIYSSGLLDPRLVVTDIRTLLLEGKA